MDHDQGVARGMQLVFQSLVYNKLLNIFNYIQ